MSSNNRIEFPCTHSEDGKIVTIDECFDCEGCNKCGTFATMLNETSDRES